MAKYRAVVLIAVEVSDILETGECSGHILTKDELKEAGITKSSTIAIDGDSKEECLQKLKEKINGFKA